MNADYMRKVVGGDIRDEHICEDCPTPCPVVEKRKRDREERRKKVRFAIEEMKKKEAK